MPKRKFALPPDYHRIEGAHTLTVGNAVVAGTFVTSDEARLAKDALFPTGCHPESGTRIEISYHPTQKQIRMWDSQDRSLTAFHVTYWQVVVNQKIEHGTLIGAPLSRKFSTRQKCRGELARIKGSHPRAYVCRMTYLCHWARSQDIEIRKALLDEIRFGFVS